VQTLLNAAWAHCGTTEVTGQGSCQGNQPLILAVENGHYELALALIEQARTRTTSGPDTRRCI